MSFVVPRARYNELGWPLYFSHNYTQIDGSRMREVLRIGSPRLNQGLCYYSLAVTATSPMPHRSFVFN